MAWEGEIGRHKAAARKAWIIRRKKYGKTGFTKAGLARVGRKATKRTR